MREKGVLIGVGGGLANVLRIQPPLSISKEELNQVVVTLKDILES
jgi:4-aminobutyrate aminotransferase-like enzyme